MPPHPLTPCAGCTKPCLDVDMRKCPRCFVGSTRTLCSRCIMCAGCDGNACRAKRRQLADRSPVWANSLSATCGQIDGLSYEADAAREPVRKQESSREEKSDFGEHSQQTLATQLPVLLGQPSPRKQEASCSSQEADALYSSSAADSSSSWTASLSALPGGGLSLKHILAAWSN